MISNFGIKFSLCSKLSLGLLFLCASPVAQEETNDTWFQIEVLVVQPTDSDALSAETWELQPQLSHSENWRIQPQRDISDELQTIYQAQTALTETGTIVVDWGKPLADGYMIDEALYTVPQDAVYAPELLPQPTRLDYRLGGLAFANERMFIIPRDNPNRLDSAIGTIPISEGTTLPKTWYWLDPKAPLKAELRNAQERLDRSESYKVRHYLRWAEILQGEEMALPIRLDTMNSGEAWPDIQGDITVFVERYLHVKTNLWLNTMAPYAPEWQMLPPPEPSPTVTHVPTMPPTSLRESEASTWDDLLPAITPLGRPDAKLEPGLSERFRYLERIRPDSNHGDGFEDPDSAYPYRHAIAIQQTRRMRSGEIHYLDHPTLGIVVSITRIEDDNLITFKRWAIQQTERP